jgi:hypothetical protein
MGAYEDFGAICGNLSSAQDAELGKFSAELTSAVCGNAVNTVADMLKQAACDISNFEDLESMLGVCEYIEKHAAANVRGGIGKGVMAHLPAVLLSIGAAFSAAPIIGAGARFAVRSSKINASKDQIRREHPELRDDPYFERYFDVLRMFSPDVAANPLIAGNVMRELHRLGPEALTPTKVKELLSLQKDFKSYQNDWHAPTSAAGSGAIALAGSDAFAARAADAGVASTGLNVNPYA